MALLVGTNHGLGKGVYAYEDGAYHAFKAAPLACKVYELPIGYWRRKHFLLEEERQLNPGWASTLNVISEPEAKLARKDAELELASHIIVPSNFVFDTLPPSLQKKASVVCYGCPEPASPDQVFLPSGPKLKVLFCGSLGQRKGLSYFFDAIRVLRPFLDVTVIGRRDSANANLDLELQGVTWYPSLPRTEVLEVMRAHDVFLFPTLFEGRALVVLEAMSQGMVVITTENAGVGDLIVHGESGYIVPIRTVEPIVAILEDLMASPDRRREVQLSALAAAASANWRGYREQLLEVLKGAVGRTNSSSVLPS